MEIYSGNCLHLKEEWFEINHLCLYLRKIEKEEQITSYKQKNRKNKVEIDEPESEKTKQKTNG